MIDANLLKEKTSARVCFIIGPNNVLIGDVDKPDEILQRVSLVLKQTLNALGIIPFRYITINGKNEYILLIFKGKEIHGMVLPYSLSLEEGLRIYYEVAGKVKGEKEEIVEAPPIEEMKEEVVLLSPDILQKLKEIAISHLGDFAEDVFNNTLEDLEIKEDNLTMDTVMEFIVGFEKASGMLIGPSRAEKMKEEMLTLIKEG